MGKLSQLGGLFNAVSQTTDLGHWELRQLEMRQSPGVPRTDSDVSRLLTYACEKPVLTLQVLCDPEGEGPNNDRNSKWKCISCVRSVTGAKLTATAFELHPGSEDDSLLRRHY